jgi:hypothetical protein
VVLRILDTISFNSDLADIELIEDEIADFDDGFSLFILFLARDFLGVDFFTNNIDKFSITHKRIVFIDKLKTRLSENIGTVEL